MNIELTKYINKYKKRIMYFKNFRNKFIKLTRRIIFNFRKKNINTYYSDLLPKDEVKGVEAYHEALDWAIKKNKKIKNIAISGPYGAGKSTIIESYVKKAKIKSNKLLRISLATFQPIDKDDLEKKKLIEKSILEQMIYKVDGKKTPFSRFKKISKISISTVWFSMVVIGLLMLSKWMLMNKSIISTTQEYLSNLKIDDVFSLLKGSWLLVTTYVTFGVSLIIVLYYLMNYILKSIKISKIKFTKVEIEVGKEPNESIYNKYLDELLYFFEETKYQIVIFEDIDRFDNSDIFMNLREVNSFINNYEKIRRRVIFLYAIKDDMFCDRDRTKFFDFIIPVIPFVDAYNSRQVVLNAFDKIFTLDIRKPSERLIKDITIFLDDMRMLTNIINEYIVYYKQTSPLLDPDKLFSIIVYKNTFPEDFHKLQYNNGYVKNVFDKKNVIIEKEIGNLEQKIIHIEKLIETSNSIVLRRKDDIIALFVRSWKSRGISSVNLSKNSNDYVDIERDDFISRIQDFDFTQQINVYGNSRHTSYSYDEFFTAFGVYDNLFHMIESIELKNEETMQRKKDELRGYIEEKNDLRIISLKNLVNKYDCNEIFDEVKNFEILMFLMKKGHIDEHYRLYISYFREGAISFRDIRFIRAIKGCMPTFEFNYELNNIEEIIKEISDDELKSEAVLNYYLVNYILSNLSTQRGRFNIILRELVKNIDLRIEFIDQFCIMSTYADILIKEICKEYYGFFNFIVNKSNFDNKKIDQFFVYIVKSCELSTLISLNEGQVLKHYIENTPHILKLVYTNDVSEKFKEIIKKLDIKFSLLDYQTMRDENDNKETRKDILIKYILDNEMFMMNESMIRFFYIHFTNCSQESMELFEAKNYSAIKGLEDKTLFNYIENNLSEYLNSVFLKLQNNLYETANVVENFLKNEDIEDKIRTLIIIRVKFVINNFKCIPTFLWDTIIENAKWDINWFNIISYFERFEELNNTIISLLNKKEVYGKLLTTNIGEIQGIQEFSKEVLESLYQYLYENENLSDEFFKKIQSVIPVYYKYTGGKMLSHRRMELIIDGENMEFTTNNLSYLKEHYGKLFQKWTYCNIDKFIENIQDMQLGIEDIIIYLQEFTINKSAKVKLVNSRKELILENLDDEILIKSIFDLNDQEIINEMDPLVLEALIGCEEFFEDRVFLLGNIINNLNLSDISKYLSKFGQPLNLLSEKGNEESKDLLLDKSKDIADILEKLVKCNYLKSFKETREGYSIVVSQKEVMVKD